MTCRSAAGAAAESAPRGHVVPAAAIALVDDMSFRAVAGADPEDPDTPRGTARAAACLSRPCPPTDWEEFVQVHDDRAIFQVSPGELPDINIHSR